MILYIDQHMIVLDKPAGMLTQPNRSSDPSIESWAKDWIKAQMQKEGNVFLHAVHRLDRDVGGIVVCARRSKALSRLQESLRGGEWKKTYHALVEGVVPTETGTWQDRLVHDNFRARVSPEGKRSLLHYEVIGRESARTALEVTLETGRYHQIRIQCASRGFPIVGDSKYGSRDKGGLLSLTHVRLELPHPMSGERLTFVTRGHTPQGASSARHAPPISHYNRSGWSAAS